MAASKLTDRKGAILVIALVTILFLGALGVAMLNPGTASFRVAEQHFEQKMAFMTAHSAAERVKAVMCRDGAVATDATSLCVLNANWTPLRTVEENGGVERAGITFPSIEAFTDPEHLADGRFITWTTENAAGTAVSYVSARYGNEVQHMKVNYRRKLRSEQPHPLFYHAIYMANDQGLSNFRLWLRKQAFKADTIIGDIYAGADIKLTGHPFINGLIKATGMITGHADGDNEQLTGQDLILPPDLSPGGPYRTDLGASTDGHSPADPVNRNQKVVFDSDDTAIDGLIGGIVSEAELTGEGQAYIDDLHAPAPAGVKVYAIDGNFGTECRNGDPTYHAGTDSAIITIPSEYNNKAVYIPGDFWFDIPDPTFIDFRDENGGPVNLTFIVKGNIYMTDGCNRGRHPAAAADSHISFIALKDNDRADNTGNIFYGDPSQNGGRIDPIKAFMYAEGDFAWYPNAQSAGDFDILGGMTAGGIIDFSARPYGESFVPINVEFDPAILDPEFRDSLPCLPHDTGNEIVPGTPYTQQGLLFL